LIGSDILSGMRLWRVWGRWAWLDVKQRYRRSVIGPLWTTISIGVTVVGIGSVFSILWGVKVAALMPHLATGLILWTFLTSVVVEGTGVFANNADVIKSINLPLSIHVFRFIGNICILFAHNAIIYVFVVFIFDVPVGWSLLLVIPGLILYLLNALWVVLVLGVVCARYRDIPQVIQNIMVLLFFITPIFWFAESLGSAQAIVNYNVMAHFVDMVRLPLLGGRPVPETWMVVGAVTVCGWAFALPFYEHKRRGTPNWL